MSDIPCIMSAPMVQALLAGRKRMTRRLAWRHVVRPAGTHKAMGASFIQRREATAWQDVEPGDLIWVRESHWRWGYWKGTKKSGNPSYEFVPAVTDGFDPMVYAEEPPGPVRKFAEVAPGYCRRPAIYHPRAASRITLKVTATRIERLQDITEEDARAEGVRSVNGAFFVEGMNRETFNAGGAKWSFALLWKLLHGAESWGANPEVVALSFDVHQQNIDTLKEAA